MTDKVLWKNIIIGKLKQQHNFNHHHTTQVDFFILMRITIRYVGRGKDLEHMLNTVNTTFTIPTLQEVQINL